jgi:hypothetical protein
MQNIGLAALTALVLSLVLAACSSLRVDPTADAQGRAVFQALQRGDWPALQPQLSPVIAGDPQLRSRLEQVRRIVPLTAPTEIRVMNWRRSGLWGAGEAHTTSVTYLYTFAERSLMVNLVFDRRGGGASVAGLHVAPVDPAVLAANRFDAPGKSWRQYGFLGLGLLSACLMITAAVLAMRTPSVEARWLWTLLAFAGVGTIWMNWTTGVVGAELAANFVGLGATRSLPPITPWILKMTVPVGAIIVLARVWMVRRRGVGAPTT